MNVTPKNSPISPYFHPEQTPPYVLSPQIRRALQRSVTVSPSQLSINARRTLVAQRTGASVLTSDRIKKINRVLNLSKTRVWTRIHGRVEERHYILEQMNKERTLEFLEKFRLNGPQTPTESPYFVCSPSQKTEVETDYTEYSESEEENSFFSSNESPSSSPIIKVTLDRSEVSLTLEEVNGVVTTLADRLAEKKEEVKNLASRLIEKEQEVKDLKEENEKLKRLFLSSQSNNQSPLKKKISKSSFVLKINSPIKQKLKEQRKNSRLAFRSGSHDFSKDAASEDCLDDVGFDFFAQINKPTTAQSTPERAKNKRNSRFS